MVYKVPYPPPCKEGGWWDKIKCVVTSHINVKVTYNQLYINLKIQ